MPLIPVAKLIVVCEKPLVIAVEAVAKPADLRVPARMPLPEFPDRLLVHKDLHQLLSKAGMHSDAARVRSRWYGETSVKPSSVNDATRA